MSVQAELRCRSTELRNIGGVDESLMVEWSNRQSLHDSEETDKP
jgi:hypothetical protein